MANKSQLAKDYTISKTDERKPGITNLASTTASEGKAEHISRCLQKSKFGSGRSLYCPEFFFHLEGRRNAIVSLDLESYRLSAGKKGLNAGRMTTSFASSRRLPLQFYCCWRYCHMQTYCRGVSFCGNCGSMEHVRKDCNSDSACPNCSNVNTMATAGSKAPPTCYTAGSTVCHVRKE